jgi:hypothetical protein
VCYLDSNNSEPLSSESWPDRHPSPNLEDTPVDLSNTFGGQSQQEEPPIGAPNVPLATTPPIQPPYMRIQYHPASQKEDSYIPLNEYVQALREADNTPTPLTSATRPPWYPFKSKEDFEFTEYVTEKRLSNSDIDNLLELMRTSWCNGLKISFQTHRDIAKAFSGATDFSATEVRFALFIYTKFLMINK